MEQNQIIPSDYNQAAEIIKTAILQGQYEALKDENRVQLAVYFGVGKLNMFRLIHARAELGVQVRLKQ